MKNCSAKKVMANKESGKQPVRFSVIIPAYNAERTIVKAVNSCLQQSYPPFEIIIINDGSTDSTEELVIKTFGDKVKYLSGPNAGPAHARNQGLELAAGDYIAFQDADDVWHIDKLKIIASILERNRNIRFLFHPYILKMPEKLEKKKVNEVTGFPLFKLFWRNPIGTPCVVMIRDQDLRFDDSMRYMEDFDLWLRAGEQYGISFLDLPLTQINRPILSAGGLSSNKKKMRLGEIKAYQHLARRNPKYLPLLPLLIGFSMLKHFVKSLNRS
jgi:teichuronic acid biosynthesis glycosyltransferase TuaG